MSLFAIILASPIIIALVALAVFRFSTAARLIKPSGSKLLANSIVLGAIGAGASLLYTIAWAIWYESSTGYGAGNAPLGWIFFYGPLSISVGEAIALVLWWLGMPRRIWTGQ